MKLLSLVVALLPLLSCAVELATPSAPLLEAPLSENARSQSAPSFRRLPSLRRTAAATESDPFVISSTPQVKDTSVTDLKTIGVEIRAVPEKTRQLEVSGDGLIEVETDLAEIQARIETSERLPKDVNITHSDEVASLIRSVQGTTSNRTAAVVQYLRSSEVAPFVSKLSTTSIRLQPITEWVNGVSRIRVSHSHAERGTGEIQYQLLPPGYESSVSVAFRAEIPESGRIIDGIVSAGVNNIDGISYVASEPKIATARINAIEQATKDARRQANSTLTAVANDLVPAANLTLVTLTVSGVTTPMAIPSYISGAIQLGEEQGKHILLSAMSPTFAPTPIMGGSKQVHATVRATYHF